MSPPSKYNYTWFVPVQFKTDVSPVESIMLNATKNSSNAHVELPPKTRWIKANMNGSGFYRVQYPLEVHSLNAFIFRKNSFCSDLAAADFTIERRPFRIVTS